MVPLGTSKTVKISFPAKFKIEPPWGGEYVVKKQMKSPFVRMCESKKNVLYPSELKIK
jgi:hypothetical protein